MRLGITEYIDCAHHLPGHTKCGRNHGHTYKVEVVIDGEVKEGMVVDFHDLKTATRTVLARYDHRDWNEFLDYPTVENICALILRDLREALPFGLLVRVWEGHGKFAESSSAT